MLSHQNLIDLIKLSLNNLVDYDLELIDRRVKEEAINHRFAFYFETLLRRNFQNRLLSFDLEYNKNYFDEKEIIDENGERIRFRPDFIVHRRMSNNNNLVVFELKKGYPNKKDKRTIRGVLNDPFNYRFSVLLSYLPGKKYFRFHIFHLLEQEIITHEYKYLKYPPIN